jgi:septal ring-binding cell division protein DamX
LPQAISLAERIAATNEWLQKTPDSHSFIQLLLTDADNEREVDTFIGRQSRILDARQIRVYRSTRGGRNRLGVIYGDFPTRSAANAVLAALAESLPSGRPYVRSVGNLRQPFPDDSRK